MVEQQENQQEHSTFSLGLDVYATVRNDLLHVLPPPLKSILSKTSFTSPLFPLSLLSFLKKCQIGMTTACRPLATTGSVTQYVLWEWPMMPQGLASSPAYKFPVHDVASL